MALGFGKPTMVDADTALVGRSERPFQLAGSHTIPAARLAAKHFHDHAPGRCSGVYQRHIRAHKLANCRGQQRIMRATQYQRAQSAALQIVQVLCGKSGVQR